jgi:hypothetical protein
MSVFLQKADVDRPLLEARYVPLADSASAFRFKKPAAPRKAALRIWCRHLSKAPGGRCGGMDGLKWRPSHNL